MTAYEEFKDNTYRNIISHWVKHPNKPPYFLKSDLIDEIIAIDPSVTKSRIMSDLRGYPLIGSVSTFIKSVIISAK